MRMIGTLPQNAPAERLVAYLHRIGIEVRVEEGVVWIEDEDKIAKATEIYGRFVQDPTNAEFDTPVFSEPKPSEEEVEEPPKRTRRAPFTSFMLALCVLFFLLNWMEELALKQKGMEGGFTPLFTSFLYDLPEPLAALEKVVQEYSLKPDQPIPPAVQAQLAQIEQLPFWKGAYPWFVAKLRNQDTTLDEGPVFVKIREGEVWRTVTPIFLHGNWLHILFNMLWLWMLGRPIEQRIGLLKTLGLTVIAAVGSNTVQYLMSGPFFLGYSGVVMALAGFIWMREKIAPWEGYPIQKGTLIFLVVFIGAIWVLQVGAFFVEVSSGKQFPIAIANAAHIAGGLIGACLGRSSFFSQNWERV